jgi:hypothetical protein
MIKSALLFEWWSNHANRQALLLIFCRTSKNNLCSIRPLKIQGPFSLE